MQYKIAFAVLQSPVPAGAASPAGVAVSITDRSGVVLPPVVLTGVETPPWTASVSGADGPGVASAVLTALDTAGKTLGTPLPVQETPATGATFPQPVLPATLTVTA
jgi:hypothetical protein